ncbi:MAG: alpha-L-arabinofuranosidase C-terminal domain-containing protein [Anaerolineae bacterium]
MSQATIRIHPDAVTGSISPYLTGACLEDVNHEQYGGIASQMLFGEHFEEEPQEIDARLDPAFAGLSGTISCRAERTHLKQRSDVRSWQPYRQGSAEGYFQHSTLRARRGRASQRITFLGGEGEAGIENRGLNRWGLNLLAGKPYEGLVVALADDACEVFVSLQSADGTQVYAETRLSVPGDHAWHPLSFNLTPCACDQAARFAVALRAPGTAWVDYCRLEPGAWGRFHELAVRRDIAEGLVNQGLTVLRQGGSMVNTDWTSEARCPGSGYRWKKMIGPREDRPPYLGIYYIYSSNGFGVIDFAALCEAAGFACVPAINPSESPADAADLVEYLNGESTTPWGARRAADGHPQPYGLSYLEFGNEEGVTLPDGRRIIRPDYPEFFAGLAQAVASRDPSITLVAAPWLYQEKELAYPENHETTRRLLAACRGHKVLWDVHVGGDGLRDGDVVESFIPRLRAYLDGIDPENRVKFCILEENGGRHDLQRALGHAHIINTVERMNGEVLIDCPANCLQPWQENDNSWDQGQLFFTPGQVWGMPPYYAQQMIARAFQPLGIRAEVQGDGGALDISAARSLDGRNVTLKVVNLEAADQPAAISVTGYTAGRVTCAQLLGELTAENTPEQPARVAPVTSEQAWEGGELQFTFPGHSFTILQLGFA